ncbi:MAG: hypothetical protein ACXWZF_09600 [Actinomycetota bacterium]
MTEIEQTRTQIERDLAELEARLPTPIRSAKTVVGAVVGSSTAAGIAGWLLRQRRVSQEAKARSTEVVVRIVTEPRAPEGG